MKKSALCKKFTSLFVTAIIFMTMFGYGNFSSAAQYEVVKDGLVAWYDAEKNTRDGYNENSLVWEDLAGNNDVEVTKNANSYFTADAFRTKNEEFKFPEEILNTINGEEFTLEAEFGKIEVLGTDFATLINSKGNDNFAFFIRKSGDYLELKTATNDRPKVIGGVDAVENSTITITFKANGMCIMYVDGISLCETEVKETCKATGYIFFGHSQTSRNHNTEFKSMRFYNRALTKSEVENNAKYNGTFNEKYVPDTSLAEFAQPSTKIVGDMMLSAIVENKASLDAIKNNADKFMPANAIAYLNNMLELTDKDGKNVYGSINDVFEALNSKATPTFYIKDTSTAEALSDYLKQTGIIDVNVMSSDPAVVKEIRTKNTAIRGAIDYTNAGPDIKDTKKLLEIRKETNSNKAKIVMLAEEDITRDVVTYLTDRQMTVWVKGQAEKTNDVSALTMAISGAHGIVSNDPANVYDILTKYFTKTSITRSIQIIGHRGVPSLKPENTLEGAIEAYNQGADMIEIDIYLTTDGVIVINHDAITSHYSQSLEVEKCTYEQLKALTNNKDSKIHMPTLEEYIKEFKGKDVMIVIEIKSNKAAIIEPLKELIEKYDFYDQSYVITFENTNQLGYMQKNYPEMPVGCLTGVPYTGSNMLPEIIKKVGKYDSGYNPSYSGYGAAYIRGSLFRGITTRPWTVNSKSALYDCISNGHAAITTDYCQWTGDMIEKISFNDVSTAKCYVGSEVKLSVNQKTHKRVVSTLDKHVVYKIISGAEYATLDKDTLKFNGAGEVVVLAEYSQILDGVYTFYAEPLKITVYPDAAEAEKNSTPDPTKKDADGNTMKYVIIAAVAVAGVAIIVAVVLIIIKNKKKTNKEGMDNDKTV